MTRRRQAEELEFGSDAFLDTLANVVGILIILVVIVGLLSGQVPVSSLSTSVDEPQATPAPPPAVSSPSDAGSKPPVPKVDLATPTQELNKLTYDFQIAVRELAKVAAATAARDEQRMKLAYDAALRKTAIEERRRKLSGDQQETFAAAQEIAALQTTLDKLDQDLGHVQEVPPEVATLKHDTTPIAQTVYGEELHFRVAFGRVSPIPIKQLIGLAGRDVERNQNRLKPGEPLEGTVGPVDDFKLNYAVEMVSVVVNGQVGAIADQRWSLEPIFPEIGEDVATALRPTSRFRTALSQVNPRKAAVTLWVYPDSFAAFRQLKEELAKLGYSCAARPLPDGQLISGSPKGSRSNAQ